MNLLNASLFTSLNLHENAPVVFGITEIVLDITLP